MAREIATGRTLDYSRGERGYYYRISYCTDRRYQYATAKAPGQCLEYGGETSFRRCSRCPDLQRIGYEFHQVEPYLRVELCMTGDFKHNPRRRKCRKCTQRLVCLMTQIRRIGPKTKVRLTLYEGK